ncbi:hypothetical protein B0T22DRAFT_502790 [Podospora appendiculata]|uniref:Single-strand DNA deaminase toxin A-like C-terminal domain-containing protein n=1 Tax=Podospora appendiculata TaxID=314037 RepID=A0AAE0XEM6_9PEZI|nr:hypothetical protein B0T22DRAFT_502790 [Podospora appendiculata]
MSLTFTAKALGLADIHVAVLEGNFRKVKEILRRSPGKKNQQSTKKLEIDVGSDLMKSTVGFIVGYGDLKPEMVAISGWKHTRPPAPGVLANAHITECVGVASRVMGFKLRKHYHDSPGQSFVSPEHEGRYLASHIEKQLAIGWVLKRKAKILIDHTVYCSSCLSFLTEVRRTTGITFVLECRPVGAPQDGDDAEVEAEELRRMDFDELAGSQLMNVDVDDADLATEPGSPVCENRITGGGDEVAQDLMGRITRDLARTPTRRGTVSVNKGSLKRRSAPNHWRVYHDKQRNIKYAKPIYPPEMARPVKIWEPVWTSRPRSSSESKKKLNLGRFKYNNNSSTSARSRQASVSRQELASGPFDILSIKPARTTSKRGAGRVTKDAQLRDKSIFARAFERHQQKQRLRQRQASVTAAPPTLNPRPVIQQGDTSAPGLNHQYNQEPGQPTSFLSNGGVTARVHPACLAQMMSTEAV